MAKVILMGEHSVIYNHYAVTVPFNNKKIFVNIKKSTYPFTNKDKLYEELVVKVCKYFGKNTNIQIDITNHVPRKRGLGSSAIFSVNIIKAIARYYDKKIDNKKIYEFAKEYEDKIHNPSSGIDIWACILNKPLKYIGGKYEILNFKLGLNLVITDTLTKGRTKEAIQLVKNHKKRDEIINRIGELTNQFIENISKEKKDVDFCLKLIKENGILLDELGLVNDKAKEIISLLNDEGIVSKISGSGLGGIVISLVKDDKLKTVLKKLKDNNLKIIGIDRI